MIEAAPEATPFRIGEILVRRRDGGAFALCHRDDASCGHLVDYSDANDATEIAHFDDAGKYRPPKTAPNLRHGWRLVLTRPADVRLALNQLSETLIHLESTTPADATLRLTGGSEGAD